MRRTDLANAQEDIDRGRSSEMYRVFFFVRMSATSCAIIRCMIAYRATLFDLYAAAAGDAPANTEDRVADCVKPTGSATANITKCCTKVLSEEIEITDNGNIPVEGTSGG